MTKYEKHKTREEWLANRHKGLGASESGAILGISNWANPIDIWKLKTGRADIKDLSNNANVAFGTRAEPALRELFHALRPELMLAYHPFDFIYQSERPWLRATLDGELTTQDWSKGILEIKTASPSSRREWDEWDDKVPSIYYSQLCHQFLATGFDYAFLFAFLQSLREDRAEVRTYYFKRDELQADLDYLLEEETNFWHFVETDTMPNAKLTF